ncbi:MAG: hypothetical protein QOE32_2178 [Pseudonocardiales bacterium]|nr:hypothetical protein [Pseudonocardiales bacterium]
METRSSTESPAARRPWVALLYFYLAAFVGFGFLIAGTTTALFGAKDLAFPELGVQSYSYESSLHRDAQGTVVATDSERAQARQRALEDRRRDGADSLVDGIILVAVGLPTLLWHLRRARRIGATTPGPRPDTAGPDTPGPAAPDAATPATEGRN